MAKKATKPTSKPRKRPKKPGDFNIIVVAQAGRLTYEAVLFAASLRQFSPGFSGRLLIAEPQPGPKWRGNPSVQDVAARDLLTSHLGAEFLPFENRHFGQDYPYGNKIEALLAAPKDTPFVFFDTDTVITGDLAEVPFDFDRPSASGRVTGTWPQPQLYGAGYTEIWRALYDRFDLDFESSLDLNQPDEYWRRYMYFNAGWFFGACPQEFGRLFLDMAVQIKRDPGPALAAQSLDPWLDQVTLPLVIHALGGGRNTLPAGLLDGATTCHYRTFPLLYARENDATIAAVAATAAPNKIKKVLKTYEPMRRFIFQNHGRKVRDMFDQNDLPPREQMIRNQIKREGLWLR